jgi:hypothetical protein
MTTPLRFLLAAPLAALALQVSAPEHAAAHGDGSWMRAAEVQLRVESRGHGLAICRGRGPGRVTVAIVDPQFAYFRHFECFVNIRGSGVLCVHTRPGKRIVLASRPPGHRLCRF